MGRRCAGIRRSGADRRRDRRPPDANHARGESRRPRDSPRRSRRGARGMRLSRRRCRRKRRTTSPTGEIARHLGAIAREVGELPVAEAHFERAQQIAQQQNNSLLLAETARERAELSRRQGRHRDALTHLNRGHRILTQMRAGRAPRRRRLSHGASRAAVSRGRSPLERIDRVEGPLHAGTLRARRRPRVRAGVAHRNGSTTAVLVSHRRDRPRRRQADRSVGALEQARAGLAPDEWELVKRHPSAGVEMLSDMNFPADIIPMVRFHHERWDGQGYPEQIAGETIPMTRAHSLHRRRLRCVDVATELQGRAHARRGDGDHARRHRHAVRSGAVHVVRGHDADARASRSSRASPSSRKRAIARPFEISRSPARTTTSPAY